VDPDRDIKWEWKYERDVNIRHHDEKPLIEEMLAREAAYKRWIDFQKTNANVVIKISQSRIRQLAKYEFIGQLPKHTYYVTMILDQAKITLQPFTLSFDISLKADESNLPFSIACVPSIYWGRNTTVIHIDGLIPQKTVCEFENNIKKTVGVNPDTAFSQNPECFGDMNNKYNGTQLAQIIILYRFLEQLQHNI
jgi:phosphoribulokinase